VEFFSLVSRDSILTNLEICKSVGWLELVIRYICKSGKIEKIIISLPAAGRMHTPASPASRVDLDPITVLHYE